MAFLKNRTVSLDFWKSLQGGNLFFRREFHPQVRPRGFVYILLALGVFLLGGCLQPTAKTAGSQPTPTEAELLSAVASAKGGDTASQPAWTGHGTLREYYLHGKYPQAELDAVADMLTKVFPTYADSQKRQMVAEILSFHHVIYHPTENHDLPTNHRTIRKYKDLLKKLCDRHGVPFYPVLAITSWENSGGSDKVSWADAAGLGQMTWGAVDEAHRYAARKAADLKEQAQWEKYQGSIDKDPARLEKARKLEEMAGRLNVEQRHRQMAKEAGVSDERAIAECNLEDVVLFYDFLLSNYGGRIDHAIGAYHKGVLNHDDILYDYLRRHDATVLYPQASDRSSFLSTLEKLNVTYLDLWNDPRSREMLNGLRTVEGERTNPSNGHLALGDESDIYPWKVLGSLSAMLAGEEYLNTCVERYSIPQLAGELRGVPAFSDEQGWKKAVNAGFLVKFPDEAWKPDPTLQRASWVRPEMVGYLLHLRDRLSRLQGKETRLPILELGVAGEERSAWEKESASKGVSVRLSSAGMSAEQKKAFLNELQQDYLFDRIYLRSRRDEHHIAINPRFGHEFSKLFEVRQGVRRASSN